MKETTINPVSFLVALLGAALIGASITATVLKLPDIDPVVHVNDMNHLADNSKWRVVTIKVPDITRYVQVITTGPDGISNSPTGSTSVLLPPRTREVMVYLMETP